MLLSALVSRRPPLLGYNHNVRHAGRVFHVQTEDYGLGRPLIVTQVFFQGSILASARTPYEPEAADEVVQRLMQAQHKQLLRQLRDGAVQERSAATPTPEAPLPELQVEALPSQARALVDNRGADAALAISPAALASLVEHLIPLDDPRAHEEGTPLSPELLAAARLLRRVSQPPRPRSRDDGDPSPAAPLSIAATTPNAIPSFSLALDDLSERTEVSLLDAAPLLAPTNDATVPVVVPLLRPPRKGTGDSGGDLPQLREPEAPRKSRGTVPRMGVAAYMGAVETPASWTFPSDPSAARGPSRPSWAADAPSVAERPHPPQTTLPPAPLAAPPAPAEPWPGGSALSELELSELINLAELGGPSATPPTTMASRVTQELGPEDSSPILELTAEPPGEEELHPPPATGAVQSLRIPRLPSQMTPPQMAQVLTGLGGLGHLRNVRAIPPGQTSVLVLPARIVPDSNAAPPTRAVPVAVVEPEETRAHPLTGPSAASDLRQTRPGRPRMDGMAMHAQPTAEGVMVRTSLRGYAEAAPTPSRPPQRPEGDVPPAGRPTFTRVRPDSEAPLTDERPKAARATRPLDGRTLDQVVLEYLAEEVSGRKR